MGLKPKLWKDFNWVTHHIFVKCMWFKKKMLKYHSFTVNIIDFCNRKNCKNGGSCQITHHLRFFFDNFPHLSQYYTVVCRLVMKAEWLTTELYLLNLWVIWSINSYFLGCYLKYLTGAWNIINFWKRTKTWSI